MQPDTISLSQDAYNAYLLREVMTTTIEPGETEPEARTRCGAIQEMFRAFNPGDAVESMIVCHCIALRFMLNAAMRDAGAAVVDAGMATKPRASATVISKTWHLWVSKYQAIHSANEKRANEAERSAPSAAATPVVPASDNATPRAAQERPRPPSPPPIMPLAVAPEQSSPPRAVPHPSSPPPLGMKAGLLTSSRHVPAISPGGRLSGAPGHHAKP